MLDDDSEMRLMLLVGQVLFVLVSVAAVAAAVTLVRWSHGVYALTRRLL